MSGNNVTSNVQLERLVLGAILANEENYWAVSDILSMDMFSTDDHQKIYAIAHELASDGRAIRVPVIAGRIGSLSGDQDPDAFLSMLLHTAMKEEELPIMDYAQELRSSSLRRQLIALANGVIKSANDMKYDPLSILDRVNERVSDISRAAAIESESTMSQTIRDIFHQAKDSEGRGIALRPCLVGLEDMIGYYPPGSLILWGGGPGSGKTAMAMQQALFTSSLHSTSLFELEMDNRSLVARSITNETGISARDIFTGLTEVQLEKLLEAEKIFSTRKFRIVSPSKMTIQNLRSRAYAHKRKYGLSLLVVDHLKLLERSTKYRMDPVERAYENARDLKSMAKDLGCAIIALCQFTKSARQKETPEPEMEDFYGGSLEEHADIMLANFNRHDWLQRNPPKTNQGKAKADHDSLLQTTAGRIELYKLKDRFGAPRDRRIFHWNGKKTIFTDINPGGQTSFFPGDDDLA